MNNLVLQVNVSIRSRETRFPVMRDLVATSVRSAKTYAERVGAEYAQFTGPRLYPDYSICMEKLSVYSEVYRGFDKIFLVDTDAVIHEACPDIFQYDRMCARPEILRPDSEAVLRKFFINVPGFRYFNSGVVLYTRSFIENSRCLLDGLGELQRRYRDARLDFYDQRVINKFVAEIAPDYHQLEFAWNAVPHFQGRHYITHYMHPWKKAFRN